MGLDWSQYDPYFSFNEFCCKETGEERMNKAFMDSLLALRLEWNRPMIPNSGFRSVKHSVEMKKASPGEHTFGEAVDIRMNSNRDKFHFLKLVLVKYPQFHRIGLHRTFIHLGTSKEFPPEVIWLY